VIAAVVLDSRIWRSRIKAKIVQYGVMDKQAADQTLKNLERRFTRRNFTNNITDKCDDEVFF